MIISDAFFKLLICVIVLIPKFSRHLMSKYFYTNPWKFKMEKRVLSFRYKVGHPPNIFHTANAQLSVSGVEKLVDGGEGGRGWKKTADWLGPPGEVIFS